MNMKAFFDSVRGKINLTTANVSGIEKVIAYGAKRNTPLNRMAYYLSTSFWETGQTMQPVKEAYWLSEAWRKKNLRYYPWYGRGLVQTTWEVNYRKIAIAMGLPENFFTGQPDKLLEWEYALPAMFIGMEQGLYTGKDVDDYIDEIDESDEEDFREYRNARRVVNAMDRADELARLGLVFEKGLKAGGYKPGLALTAEPATEPVAEKPGFWTRLWNALFGD